MLESFQKSDQILEQYSASHIFSDFSQHTLQMLRNLMPVTKNITFYYTTPKKSQNSLQFRIPYQVYHKKQLDIIDLYHGGRTLLSECTILLFSSLKSKIKKLVRFFSKKKNV